MVLPNSIGHRECRLKDAKTIYVPLEDINYSSVGTQQFTIYVMATPTATDQYITTRLYTKKPLLINEDTTTTPTATHTIT